MKIFACKKCGSLDTFIKEKGKNGVHHKGLYCGDCGSYQKFLTKEEIVMFERFESARESGNIPSSATVYDYEKKS